MTTKRRPAAQDGEYFALRGEIPSPPPDSSSSEEESEEESEETEKVSMENEKKMLEYAEKKGLDEKQEEEKKKEEEKRRRRKKKSKKKAEVEYYSYKGCTYKVGFKVDRPIVITAVEFLGPIKAVLEYPVEIQIQRIVEDWLWIPKFLRFIWPWGPYFKVEELLPLSRASAFGVKKGEKFKITLPYPVEVDADKLTDIKFELLGVKTKRMTRMYPSCQVLLNDVSVANFEFLHGSHQLTGIYFRTG